MSLNLLSQWSEVRLGFVGGSTAFGFWSFPKWLAQINVTGVWQTISNFAAQATPVLGFVIAVLTIYFMIWPRRKKGPRSE